jgi:hypothetical protein
MFIISLFAGSIFRMIFLLFGGLILLTIVSVVGIGALATRGGPGACTPGGGPVSVDAASADTFQKKWDAFNAALDGKAPGSIAISESELTSRAKTYLGDHDAGFHDPRICLHNGYGEGSATFSRLGMDVKLKIKGTMDLTGAHPKAKIDKMQIGSLPGWLTAPAERVINRALESALNDLDFDHRYAPSFTEGNVTVAGTP